MNRLAARFEGLLAGVRSRMETERAIKVAYAGAGVRRQPLFLQFARAHRDVWDLALRNGWVVCVPQDVSLPTKLSRADLNNHVLRPTSTPGTFDTMAGGVVQVVGNELRTQEGFRVRRSVRITITEEVSEESTEGGTSTITIMYISRPLVGGVDAPDAEAEMGRGMLQRMVGILRAFPEAEGVLFDLDRFIDEFNALGKRPQGYEQLHGGVLAYLKSQWSASVDALLSSGCFGDVSVGRQRLQIQMAVQHYLLEGVHEALFAWLRQLHAAQDASLWSVIEQMQGHSQADLGMRPEFHCSMDDAVKEFSRMSACSTPMEKLLSLKRVCTAINDAVEAGLAEHYRDVGAYQLTTDDLVDELIFVISAASPRHLYTEILYCQDYHFLPISQTSLGYVLANLEVAAEWFALKESQHRQSTDLLSSANARRLLSISQPRAVLVAGTNTHKAREQPISPAPRTQWREAPRRSVSVDVAASSRVTILGSEEHALVGIGGVASVAVGPSYYVAVGRDGSVSSWGLAHGSRLGFLVPSSEMVVSAPRRVQALQAQRVLNVSCGAFHCLAITAAGRLWSWGNNQNGQLGIGRCSRDDLEPHVVRSLPGQHVVACAAGSQHSLALTENGTLWSWGKVKCGRLGRVSAEKDSDPVPAVVPQRWQGVDPTGQLRLPPASSAEQQPRAVAVAAGWGHSLAVTADGSVFSWGCGQDGRLGHGCHSDQLRPKQVMAISDPSVQVLKAAGGYSHSLLLTRTGAVYAFGLNSFGQTGVDEAVVEQSPLSFSFASASGALDDSRTEEKEEEEESEDDAYDLGLCPGTSDLGDECAEAPDVVTLPRPVAGLEHTRALDVFCGEHHSLAVTEAGVFVWGLNAHGACGLPAEVEEARVPVLLSALADATAVVAGGGHTVAVF